MGEMTIPPAAPGNKRKMIFNHPGSQTFQLPQHLDLIGDGQKTIEELIIEEVQVAALTEPKFKQIIADAAVAELKLLIVVAVDATDIDLNNEGT